MKSLAPLRIAIWAVLIARAANADPTPATAPDSGPDSLKEQNQIYVTESGNDAASGREYDWRDGSQNGPMRTIEGARNRIRTLGLTHAPEHPFKVIIRAGRYYQPHGISLTHLDSGSNRFPISYEAFPGEHPRLIGGIQVRGGKTQNPANVNSTTIVPFESEHQDRDGRLLGLYPTCEIFRNGTRVPQGRWPEFSTDGELRHSWAIVSRVGENPLRSFYCSALPKALVGQAHLHAHIFAGYDWFDEDIEINSIAPSGEITLKSNTAYPLVAGLRFYVGNVPNEPRSWSGDASTKTIRIQNPLTEPTSDELLMSTTPNVLTLDGVANVTFSGLVFEVSNWDAIALRNVENVSFFHCLIRNCGGWALRAVQSHAVTLSSNIISSTGLGGISLESGSAQTMQRSDSTISANIINDVGERLICYEPAISIIGVGIDVRGNELTGGGHCAILFSGVSNTISGNILSNFCTESQDCGAIYAGRDWATRDTTICDNSISHIHGWMLENRAALEKGNVQTAIYRDAELAHAIYLDDLLDSVRITNNQFSDISSFVLHIGGGRYIAFDGNFLRDCGGGVLMTKRGSTAGIASTLDAYLKSDSPLAQKFPELATRATDHPLVPRFISITGNSFVNVDEPYSIKLLGLEGTHVDNNRFTPSAFFTRTKSWAQLETASGQDISVAWPAWVHARLDEHSRISPSDPIGKTWTPTEAGYANNEYARAALRALYADFHFQSRHEYFGSGDSQSYSLAREETQPSGH